MVFCFNFMLVCMFMYGIFMQIFVCGVVRKSIHAMANPTDAILERAIQTIVVDDLQAVHIDDRIVFRVFVLMEQSF